MSSTPGSSTTSSTVQPPPANVTRSTKLSFDEIARFFNLPIAEAASNLGVCTSVLKRLCRENGIIRWPYRKFLAGKTIEEIREEAEMEKAKDRAEKITKQKVDITKISSPLGAVSSGSHHGQGVLLPGQTPQQGPNIPNSVKHIPTYMDEFKFGFPSNGLSCATNKWWGSCYKDDTESNLKGENNSEEKDDCSEFSDETSLCMDDQVDSDTEEDSDAATQPSLLLCSLRKKSVTYHCETLKTGIFKDQRPYKLSGRQRSMLLQVFKSSLPHQWKNIF